VKPKLEAYQRRWRNRKGKRTSSCIFMAYKSVFGYCNYNISINRRRFRFMRTWVIRLPGIPWIPLLGVSFWVSFWILRLPHDWFTFCMLCNKSKRAGILWLRLSPNLRSDCISHLSRSVPLPLPLSYPHPWPKTPTIGCALQCSRKVSPGFRA